MTTKSQGRSSRGRVNSPALSISGIVRAMPRRPKAYSYVRFSSPEQAKGDSLRRQTEAAERYAAEQGLELDTSLRLRDLGVSAFRGANVREGGALHAFIEAIKRGRVKPGSVLLIESLDRLSRQSVDDAIDTLKAIIRAGVDVVTLTGSPRRFDKSALQGFGYVEAALILLRANEESATKSARVKASWVRRRKDYGPDAILPGQKYPFWVRVGAGRKAKVDARRGRIAQRIALQYIAGRALREIVRDLNSDGIPPPGNGKQGSAGWSRIQVSRTLRSLATKDGPSPLSRSERSRLRAALARRRSEGRPRRDGETNVLHLLARCSYCGRPLSYSRVPKKLAGGRRQEYAYLRCTTNAEFPGKCDGPQHIRYDVVAQATVELALAAAEAPPAVSPKAAQQAKAAAGEARRLLDKADRLRLALEAAPSKLGTVALRNAFQAYQAAQTKADAAWDAARPGYGTIDVQAIRAAASDAQMNAALRVFLESVEVRHDDPKPDHGIVTFRYAAGGTAALRYVAAARKRADAGKPKRRRNPN